MDLQKAFDAGFSAVKGYVERSFDAVYQRIDALEKRAPEKGEKGDSGERGAAGIGIAAALINRDGELVVTLSDGTTKSLGEVMGRDGAAGRDGADGKDGSAGPAGESGADGAKGDPGASGRDGVDGKDGAAGEPGASGIDGVNGKDGNPGRDGVDGVNGVDGKDADPELIKVLVADAVAALPAPKDGKDGVDGANGRDGIDGAKGLDGKNGLDGKDGAAGVDGTKGADGRDGKDGIGLAGAMIDRDGGLILTLTDGTTKSLGVVVGKDGSSGRDGIDGINGKDGRDGIDGKSIDPSTLETMTQEYVPDYLAENVSIAVKMLAEAPAIQKPKRAAVKNDNASLTLNINSVATSPRQLSKTITTKRDADGNLVAEVVEQESE